MDLNMEEDSQSHDNPESHRCHFGQRLSQRTKTLWREGEGVDVTWFKHIRAFATQTLAALVWALIGGHL